MYVFKSEFINLKLFFIQENYYFEIEFWFLGCQKSSFEAKIGGGGGLALKEISASFLDFNTCT